MNTKPLFASDEFIQGEENLFARPAAPSNEPMSVSALSSALRDCIESAFSFVRVRGEISGLKKAASGHLYFSLKDADAVIDAVCWRGTASRLSVAAQDGLEVVCTGKITAYPSRSKYQIVVDSMQIAGIGALLQLLEERRQKLQAEGLFDPARKKKIPFLPNVIGVVTSPTGAVIRDIIHRVTERFPTRILLWGSLVQGEDAARQIATGIRGFNAIPKEGLQTPAGFIPRPDVIIVARGGGSFEDLWCFNDEDVVRAAAASDIPLISAVGHETDTTLIDYAADLRAPTPTGAAEKAVPVRLELAGQINADSAHLSAAVTKLLDADTNILAGLSRGLPPLDRVIADYALKVDDRAERLKNAALAAMTQKALTVQQTASRLIHPANALSLAANVLIKIAQPLDSAVKNILTLRESRLQTASRLLESCSYKSVLDRGFALVTDANGRAVTSAAQASGHKRLDLIFKDGKTSVVTDGGRQPKRKDAADDRQGLLL